MTRYVITDDATPHALRCRLEAEALAQHPATRWRLVDIMGGVRVYDDVAGTVTEYLVDDDWD